MSIYPDWLGVYTSNGGGYLADKQLLFDVMPDALSFSTTPAEYLFDLTPMTIEFMTSITETNMG